MNRIEPIETAGELYREIRNRGLHLRRTNGRDNALLQELTSKLGCKHLQLQRFLDTSDLSAEAFLKVFLQLAAPFACMFKEIWDYLNGNCAPEATETMSVRFGFKDSDDRCEIDLEQFRRYAETAQRVLAAVTTQLWPDDALHGLFEVGRKLVDDGTWREYGEISPYKPGKPYDLPLVRPAGHHFDQVIKSVRHVFQQIIDGYVTEPECRENGTRIPEVKEDTAELNSRPTLRRAAFLLTDLLPHWYYILARCPDIHSDAKDAALHEYAQSVEPLLKSRTGNADIPLFEALEVLDLPFWRHRWHTYEVWASMLTLQCLQDYKPALKISEGHVALDGYSAAVVANLKAREHADACVAVQVKTPFMHGGRQFIKPELRVCFGESTSSDNTAGVVEFKQRCRIDSKALIKLALAYSAGCPNSGGVVILNYDTAETRFASARIAPHSGRAAPKSRQHRPVSATVGLHVEDSRS